MLLLKQIVGILSRALFRKMLKRSKGASATPERKPVLGVFKVNDIDRHRPKLAAALVNTSPSFRIRVLTFCIEVYLVVQCLAVFRAHRLVWFGKMCTTTCDA